MLLSELEDGRNTAERIETESAMKIAVLLTSHWDCCASTLPAYRDMAVDERWRQRKHWYSQISVLSTRRLVRRSRRTVLIAIGSRMWKRRWIRRIPFQNIPNPASQCKQTSAFGKIHVITAGSVQATFSGPVVWLRKQPAFGKNPSIAPPIMFLPSPSDIVVARAQFARSGNDTDLYRHGVEEWTMWKKNSVTTAPYQKRLFVTWGF